MAALLFALVVTLEVLLALAESHSHTESYGLMSHHRASLSSGQAISRKLAVPQGPSTSDNRFHEDKDKRTPLSPPILGTKGLIPSSNLYPFEDVWDGRVLA